MPKNHCLLLAGWLMLVVVGCGGPAGKAQVTGSVTFNGKPLPDGQIIFFVAPTVPAGAGPIQNGQFAFLCKPGKMTVDITATREGKFDASEQANTKEQFLPSKYNRETELTAEVTLGGKNQFHFPLTGE